MSEAEGGMARNETVSEQMTTTRGLHRLLILGGLGLFIGGLLVAGVFGGAVPSILDDLGGAEEPPIDDDSVAPPDANETPPSDEDDDDDEQPVETDDDDDASDGSPEFGIAELSVSSPVLAGDTVEVTVDVVNRGDANGSTDVMLAISGDELGQEALSLEPGESTAVTYLVETDDLETGQHEVSVATAHDEQQESLEIEERGDPMVSVVDLDVPPNVTVGDSFDVTYTIRNTGDGSGTADVNLRFGGDGLATEEVSLAPNESVTITTTIDTDGYDPGEYAVTITTPERWDRTWISLEADTDDDDADDGDDGDDSDDEDDQDDEDDADDGEDDGSDDGDGSDDSDDTDDGDDGEDDDDTDDDDGSGDDGDGDDGDDDDDGGLFDF